MRKTIIFAAVAALAMLSSCQKEVASEQESDELTFTASIIDQSTRTTIDTDANSETKGKVSWEVGDEITVRDGTNKAVYYIKDASDIAADGTASFTYKSGSRLSSSASKYTATYINEWGEVPVEQTYTTTVGKLPMIATSDASVKTKLNFKVYCGLLKLNLTAAEDETDKTISKVEVYGYFDNGDTYTLNCGNESISSANDFCIALTVGMCTTIKFTNGSGHICYKTAKEALSIDLNTICPLTITDLTFDDKLPGKFSVAPGKQVQFSKGNLCCKRTSSTSNWGFYDEQYQYNSLNIGETRTATPDDTEIDLFTWGFGIWSPSPTTAEFCIGEFYDWGTAIDNKGTWRTLTGGEDGEWKYLLKTRTVNINGDSKPSYGLGNVEGTNGLIILPDNWDGDVDFQYGESEWSNILSSADWNVMENAGCVFLPTAGERLNESIYNLGSSGGYWSSSRKGIGGVYYMLFYSKHVEPVMELSGVFGKAVRLVSDTPVYYGNLNGGAANMDWGEDDSNNWE